MNVSHGLKWLHRHSTTSASLVLLLELCAALHFLAVGTITILSDLPQGTWPPRLIRNMAGIQFFDSKWWFTLPYLFLFFATLIYTEVRALPRWAVWTVFLFLALPILGYMWTCARVGCCFFADIGPLREL